MSFQTIPSLDLLHDKVVRLKKGDPAQCTVYGEPMEIVRKARENGIKRFHVVDLGRALNLGDHTGLIKAVIREFPDMDFQVGGGIRTLEDCQQLINAGAKDLVIGSLITSGLMSWSELTRTVPTENVILALDILLENGVPTITDHGWTKSTGMSIHEMLEKDLTGLKRILVTDVSRDGIPTGPNFELYRSLKTSGLDVIASGGVRDLADLDELKQMNLFGAIVGRSYYEGTLK